MKKTLLFLLITVTASVLAMAGLGLANNAFKSPKADSADTGFSYTIPTGTIQKTGDPENWLDNLSTTGAFKDIAVSYNSNPASDADLYTLVADEVEAIPGSTFTLNVNAHKKGAYSTTDVYQDLRFCAAYIWVD